MRKDATFRAAYRRAGLITADGFPIALACNLRGKRVSRVAGSDLIAPISAEAARSGKSIYLFGSSSQALTEASRLLRERNLGILVMLAIVGCMIAGFASFFILSRAAGPDGRQRVRSGGSRAPRNAGIQPE